MNTVSQVELPANSFLSSAFVTTVADNVPATVDDTSLDALIRLCADERVPLVVSDSDKLPAEVSAAMLIPTFHGSRLASVTVLTSKSTALTNTADVELVGVFESWKPIGKYEEVALSAGYYGKMERFANVSSFVRFERCSGLPGQVWENLRPVIHDDLTNHPGFLRAAGASAELLQTAVGVPVYSDRFVASALLISSHRTPIARGMEVWVMYENEFELTDASYTQFDDSFVCSTGARLSANEGWADLLRHAGGAVSCAQAEVLLHGKTCAVNGSVPTYGLAMPCFKDGNLDSFLALYF